MRREDGGTRPDPGAHRGVLRQARVMRALYDDAAPRIRRVLFEDPGDPPAVAPLFRMEIVRGEDLESILTAADIRLPADEVLYARTIEAVSVLTRTVVRRPEEVGLADEPVVSLHAEIERWERACETVDPALVPGWSGCAARLHASVPPAQGPCISHGDYRLGNLLAVSSTVAAVIDWEIWSVSDPRLDLAWFAMFTDQGAHPLALRKVGSALPTPDAVAQAYAGASGAPVPDLAWYHALIRFKEAAIAALLVKHGRRRSIPPPRTEELAASSPVLLRDALEML